MCAIRMRPTSGLAASTMQIGRRGMPILKLWRPQATKLASRTHKGNDDRKKARNFLIYYRNKSFYDFSLILFFHSFIQFILVLAPPNGNRSLRVAGQSRQA